MKKYEKISVSALIDILSQHRQHIMIKLKYMQATYQGKGVKHVNGVRK
jgi:hypothetical protein